MRDERGAIDLIWRCRNCNKGGLVSVYPYRGESSVQTAERHAKQTRERCVSGCPYRAQPEIEAFAPLPTQEPT